ncbi:alpha-2,8-sialyltransferase 8E isoform X5 [Panthera tigris]|uniref:alpha-2,8-sialyltransferase 8E isoform X5 n=1 Tax=Panthera tigris TaxID=9694 RepID=UPI001C6F8EE9|nr:alpha-2,8-sialyltransferase 8E isoform X5 [Panthera tigris]
MRYADPSANRDLLGNRTLLFIFICAFALVTLLQQILYGRNYIKRSLQFGWQSGDQLANWTGLFNVTDDPAVQSGSDSSSRSPGEGAGPSDRSGKLQIRPHRKPGPDRAPNGCGQVLSKEKTGEGRAELESVYFEFYEGPFEYNSTRCLELRHEILEVKVLSMVKQSELFDRWKSLQMCRWAMNISEANQFKSTLSRCCNAPSFLFTTQKNTPLGTKLKYEVDTSGIYHINQEIFRMFPKVQPTPHLREVHHGCGSEDGCGHCEPQHHHREVPQVGEVAAALLPGAAGVRERVGATARLLQHAQHRRVHPRQVRAGRLRVDAGRVLLPPAIPGQRVALLAQPGGAREAHQHRPHPGHGGARALRGGAPVRLLGLPHEPLGPLHHPPLL